MVIQCPCGRLLNGEPCPKCDGKQDEEWKPRRMKKSHKKRAEKLKSTFVRTYCPEVEDE